MKQQTWFFFQYFRFTSLGPSLLWDRCYSSNTSSVWWIPLKWYW